jgi:hypothetical protein
MLATGRSTRLTPGDVVTVTRIDRLARSTFDLFAIAGIEGSVFGVAPSGRTLIFIQPGVLNFGVSPEKRSGAFSQIFHPVIITSCKLATTHYF